MSTSRPSTGLPPGVHVGATGSRLLAAVIEAGPVWLLLGLAALFGPWRGGPLVLVILLPLLALGWSVLVWAGRATRAAGPGMRTRQLQIVGFRDGRPIGWQRVLIRAVVFAGLSLTVVGLIALLIVQSRHPRRQGWHDLAAAAVVIKQRPLAPPRPKPAVSRPAAVPAVVTPAAGAPAETPVQPAEQAITGSATAQTAEHEAVTAETHRDGADADQESPAEPEEAVESEPQEPEPAYEWWLRLDDGRDVGIGSLVLLGRNPQPRVGEEDASLIKVGDTTRTVSKSHLAVGVDARGVYVMDRGSTNGTTVTAPDGGRRSCPPGDVVDVTVGSIVSFGDHWLEVRRPED